MDPSLPEGHCLTPVEILEGERSGEPAAGEVIVLLLWHLGDVLNATALLPDLAARHGRKLTFATTRACVPILARHPSLARIRVVDRALPETLSPADWHELSQLHRALFPDASVVYNLHIPIRLPGMSHHIIETWGRAVGIEKAWHQMKPAYYPDPSGTASPFAGDHLVLGSGGSSARKHWPAERWRGLVEWLRSRHHGLRLVQIGGPGDPPIEGVEDHRGTTVDESYRVLTDARACVTNDSFLAHLACAAECPTVVIFGPTCSMQFRPLGGAHVSNLGGHGRRTPCTRNFCRFFPNRPCFAFPSLHAVRDAVDSTLRDGDKRS